MNGSDAMSIEEYKKFDPEFDEQLFLSKVQNMFIKYFSAVMLDKLETVKHFVSDSVYQDGVNLVNEWKSRKARHMYDMLNALLHFNTTDSITGIQYHREKEYWIYDIICDSDMYNNIIKPIIDKYFNIYSICEPIILDRYYNGKCIYYTTFKSKNVLTDNIIYIDDNDNITTDNIDSVITLESGEKLCI